MTEFETVIHIMMLNQISYEQLGKQLGNANGGNLYNTLNKNKHMYVDTLRNILDELGYELVAREKGKETGGFIIDDDNTPSPLRFHGMNLNVASLFAKKPVKKICLTKGERNMRCEEMKKHISEMTFEECDKKLREMWSIKDTLPSGRKPYNEYEGEYHNYLKEFELLYQSMSIAPVTPVSQETSGGAHGKIITEDSEEIDMSPEAIRQRADEDRRKKNEFWRSLGLDMDFE